jgi:hypothetical protein
MSHHYANREVHVTAQERAHPALRVLSRACIALARHELATERRTSPPAAGGAKAEARHD